MYFWVFEGPLGKGKTSAMSLFAHYYKQKMKKLLVDTTLYANYALTDSKPLHSYETFYELAAEESSICLIDEGHTAFDSRMFGKSYAVYFTQFAFYFRKLRSCMMLATPSIDNLDSRIRLLTNILVHVEKSPAGFTYWIFDYQSNKLLQRKFLPMYNAKRVFSAGLYNTNEIVRAITFPTSEKEFDLFLTNIQKISDKYGQDATTGEALTPALVATV